MLHLYLGQIFARSEIVPMGPLGDCGDLSTSQILTSTQNRKVTHFIGGSRLFVQKRKELLVMNENLFSFSFKPSLVKGSNPNSDSTAFLTFGSDVNAHPRCCCASLPPGPFCRCVPVANAQPRRCQPVKRPAAAAPMATAWPLAARACGDCYGPSPLPRPWRRFPVSPPLRPWRIATALKLLPRSVATAWLPRRCFGPRLQTATAPQAAAAQTAPAPAATTADATNNVVPFALPAQGE